MKLTNTGWIESLSIAELQRLSRAFNSVADLHQEEDRNINDWLKQTIGSKQTMAAIRSKAGLDEWGDPVGIQ
jgi:hypothetical protein